MKKISKVELVAGSDLLTVALLLLIGMALALTSCQSRNGQAEGYEEDFLPNYDGVAGRDSGGAYDSYQASSGTGYGNGNPLFGGYGENAHVTALPSADAPNPYTEVERAPVTVSEGTADRVAAIGGADTFENRDAVIPVPEPVGAASAPVLRQHRILAGETLWRISRMYGVSVEALKAANGLSSNLIIAGELLVIPQPGGTVARAN